MNKPVGVWTSTRRAWLRSSLTFGMGLALLSLAGPSLGQAVDWPQRGRPVRIVIPFPAGSDNMLRLIAQRLGEQTGGTFIVDNKPGAGTLIGAQDVARAPADGHTLLYTIVVTHTQNPHLYKKLPYDPFRDFTPIVQTVRSGTILVTHPKAPFNNVQEMVAYAKKNPGALNYASYSLGSTSHLNGEILKHSTGLDIVHVPYKGVSDATRVVMAGDVQLYFDGTASAIESAKAGKLKLLGVAGDKRLAVRPDLPTISEQGVSGIDILGWQGFFAPGGLPAPLADKIAAAVRQVMQTPELQEVVRLQGNEVSGAGPEAFGKIVRSDYERWGEVIKRTGIQLD
ncbi:MAG: tripartite tricarboxylate transporter substrate binding protein [Hydrogenophaga sp.]|nr:tripartite tricarboxylate transporter substrate binding protein [Hydrogenophaga sp.]